MREAANDALDFLLDAFFFALSVVFLLLLVWFGVSQLMISNPMGLIPLLVVSVIVMIFVSTLLGKKSSEREQK